MCRPGATGHYWGRWADTDETVYRVVAHGDTLVVLGRPDAPIDDQRWRWGAAVTRGAGVDHGLLARLCGELAAALGLALRPARCRWSPRGDHYPGDYPEELWLVGCRGTIESPYGVPPTYCENCGGEVECVSSDSAPLDAA